MNLRDEIEAMDQLLDVDEDGYVSDEKLNVNTVLEAITQKQEEILSMEEVYRVYPEEALHALQKEVMMLAKMAVTQTKDTKEKEDIQLSEVEFISRSAVLEAVSRIEDQINYHKEKLETVLTMQADSLGDYLEKRNVAPKEIAKIKDYYLKHGEITEDLRNEVLGYIGNFLQSKNENAGNIDMVKEVVENELDSIRLTFSNYALAPRTLRYAKTHALLKFSSVPYIDFDKYLEKDHGFSMFIKDYKIDTKLAENLIDGKNSSKDMDTLWQNLVEQNMINLNSSNQEEVRKQFENDMNKLIDHQKNSKEKVASNNKEETITTHFRTLCKNMSFTDHQTNELLEVMKENKKPLQFKNGQGLYRVLKEQIIPAQQKKIPMNGNREETIRACQQLIKERQEFFQNVYQYSSMIKKDPDQHIQLSEGKKIIKQRKNTDTKVSKNIFAAVISRENAALQKFRNRYFKRGNYSLTVGSMVRIPFDNAPELEVRVNAIKVFDETNMRPYYSASPGETIEELMQMHQLNEKHKLSFGCEIYTEDGRHRWIEYDPFHSFAYDENAYVEGETKVK